MAAVHLPDLRRKLGILYAHSGMNGVSLARRIGRAEPTLTGWLQGTGTNLPDHVPDFGRARLSEILVEELGGTIDIAAARTLWLGPLKAFSDAFNANQSVSFAELLARTPRQPMLTYLAGSGEGRRTVSFFSNIGLTPGAIAADVGDRFGFEWVGAPGALMVLIVESPIGIHLGVPAPGARSRLNAKGKALLPDDPHFYTFEAPAGVHKFFAFAIDASEPLSIAAFAGRVSPLPDKALETFVLELSDNKRVRSWALDSVLVHLR